MVDPVSTWTTVAAVTPDALGIVGLDARNAALYFPRVIQANPLHGDQPGNVRTMWRDRWSYGAHGRHPRGMEGTCRYRCVTDGCPGTLRFAN